MKVFLALLCLLSSLGSLSAFSSSRHVVKRSTALSMAEEKNDDLLRWAKASRQAGSDDNVVELNRPLGLILTQDDNGNVYVETVAPKGNAARSGKVGRKQFSSIFELTKFLIPFLMFQRRSKKVTS
jgi:hypothetical protein